jgi:tripartite-type tricarboxylate transporter receptor subunit TctC
MCAAIDVGGWCVMKMVQSCLSTLYSRRLAGLALAGAALLGFTAVAPAQSWPARSVRIIVPFAPGGASDTSARLLLPRLTETFGQPFVVENRPGAGGTIGADIAAKAPADGHSLLMGSSTEIALNPNLYAKLGYDTVRDFAPISMVASTPLLLVVHPVVPSKTVQDLTRIARASPGKLNYASSGNGSSPHMAAEMYRWISGGLDMVHVPFPNAGAGVTGVLNGQVDFMFAAMPNVVGQVQAGKLRALAISTGKRSAVLPSVPTMAEAGVKDYEIAIWNGMLAPAATPREIINRLNAEIVRIVALPEVREGFAKVGAEPVTSTPEQFAAYIRSELAKWARVVKASGTKLE